VCNFKPNETVSASKMNAGVLSKLLWDKANLRLYQAVLCDALASISLPLDALLCKQVGCQRHSVELERYYIQILLAVLIQLLNSVSHPQNLDYKNSGGPQNWMS